MQGQPLRRTWLIPLFALAMAFAILALPAKALARDQSLVAMPGQTMTGVCDGLDRVKIAIDLPRSCNLAVTGEATNGWDDDMDLVAYDAQGKRVDSFRATYDHAKRSMRYDGSIYLQEGRNYVILSSVSLRKVRFSLTLSIPFNAFTDVDRSDWYVTGGLFDCTIDHGLMGGYAGTTKFGPYDDITRGQVACVLYNLAGSPEVGHLSPTFDDVDYGAYYGDAIRWARALGIVHGYGSSNDFQPDRPVSREELACMLANYVDRLSLNRVHSDCSALDQIEGADQVSSWARESMGWAVDRGLISGVKVNGVAEVQPQGNAWRASAATMVAKLHRDVLGL